MPPPLRLTDYTIYADYDHDGVVKVIIKCELTNLCPAVFAFELVASDAKKLAAYFYQASQKPKGKRIG